MVVTVIAPKAQFFTSKSLDVQRTYLNYFKKYLNMLIENNVTIQYYIEDELMHNLMSELKYDNVLIITAIADSDFQLTKTNRELLNLPEYLYSHDMSKVKPMLYDSDKKYSVSPSLLREVKEIYVSKRVEVARKRIRYAMDKQVREGKNVLLFRADSTMDRTSPVHDTVILGDGRLCIEVSLSSGLCVVYYGGSYIPENMVPEILKL